MSRSIQKLKSWILPGLLFLIVLAILISKLIFPAQGSSRIFMGASEEYYQSLKDAGFPDDYAAALTELHMLHPTWSFSPLEVTKNQPQYTWSYVIDKEHEKAYNNIIYSTDTYAAYHHPTNKESYDSGHYQVSREALEYFMDPRNFLNETDIFQFYSLSNNFQATRDSIESLLRGTFMEDAVLENGMTYSAYFTELGNTLGINPLFLATKVRQEQGVQGSSPLISGECGSALLEYEDLAGYTEEELLSLNGYYNYFNINATGKGSFEVYLNAIRYAKETGTAGMKNEWNGSASWNTRWKALYGGAAFLMNNYIGKHQDTIYLQKFNVDSRADNNFAHQYMATVHGAMSEARMLFQSYSTTNLLDEAAHFVIPVYDEMPQVPCPDPAAGTCNQTAQATKRYEFQLELTEPVRLSTQNAPIYLQQEVYGGDCFELTGMATHKYPLEGFEYSWDGGEWVDLSDASSFQKKFICNYSEAETHILVIRGTASYQTASQDTLCTNFLYAVIYVKVIPRPNVTVTYQVGDTTTNESYIYGSHIKLPSPQEQNFIGWKSLDGSFLPSDAEIEVTEELAFSAVFWNFQPLEGASLVNFESMPRLRFSAVLKKEDFDFLSAYSSEPISYSVLLQNGTEETQLVRSDIAALLETEDAQWVRFDALTAPLKPNEYKTPYTAHFALLVRYTNGDVLSLDAAGTPSVRSAKEVALAALADKTVSYSPTLITMLQSVCSND